MILQATRERERELSLAGGNVDNVHTPRAKRFYVNYFVLVLLIIYQPTGAGDQERYCYLSDKTCSVNIM